MIKQTKNQYPLIVNQQYRHLPFLFYLNIKEILLKKPKTSQKGQNINNNKIPDLIVKSDIVKLKSLKNRSITKILVIISLDHTHLIKSIFKIVSLLKI